MQLLEKTFIIIIISTITSFSTTIKVADKPELFTTDKLGNCYVYVNDELIKYSQEGKRIADFIEYSLGKIHSIDVADPMKIMLFYKETNSILFLDNKLNQIGEPIYIEQLVAFSATEICSSKDNAVWLYDNFNYRIIKYGFNPNAQVKEIYLPHFDEGFHINFMLESGNELYLIDKSNVIRVYDLYNETLSKVKVKSLSKPQVISGNLYFHNHKHLMKHNIETEKTDTIKIGELNNFEDIKFSAGNYYVLKSN